MRTTLEMSVRRSIGGGVLALITLVESLAPALLLLQPLPSLADDYDDEYDDGEEDFAEFEAFQRAAAGVRETAPDSSHMAQEAPPDMVDTDDDCLAWAAEGECDANPEWMVPNCGRSCFDQVPP